MSEISIAIVGTDTAEGKLFLEQLENCQEFTFGNIFPIEKLPDEYSAIRFKNKSYLIEKLDEFDFSKANIVFFFSSERYAEEAIPKALDEGCYVIDASGANLSQYEPLQVIPEINGDLINEYHCRYLVSPNSTALQATLALHPLVKQFGIEQVNIVAMESVSSEGKSAINELANQTISLMSGRPIQNRHFPVQIALNIVPSIIDEKSNSYYSSHEMFVIQELSNFIPELYGKLSVNCYSMPVFYGTSIHLSFKTSLPISNEEIINLYKGCEYIDYEDKDIVTPVTHGVSKDKMTITRVRPINENSSDEFSLFAVLDNTMKGNVLNCIQIARKVIEILE